jgi:phage tail-like protein
MARSVKSDPYHSMRFIVVAQTADGTDPLVPTGNPQAGFTQVSTPDVTTESVEYKEGHWLYKRKYPGTPEAGDVSLTRGVMRKDTTFWDWARAAAEGSASGYSEYRADLLIYVFHRQPTLTTQPKQQENLTMLDITNPGIVLHCDECFATTCKPMSDLDSNSSDIAVSEITAACEHFWIERTAKDTE